MTEQSQMPLVGPPKRRGWREVVWFRPLTPSTHAALVVTRRGRLVSILPAGAPRVLSDYLAWPYSYREVDTRERLLVLDQRVESFDSSHEFSVALRLIYQVAQPDRVALELDDVSTELAHAVVQSLRLSGRSFGVEQDKTFEEHLQDTLISGEALSQRVQLLGLVLRRADVTVALDEATRAHAEALRFAMRERPLHFQLAIESLEPDRSFDVVVGGTYRLTERRIQDGPSDSTDRAIQLAIAHTLRRVGITFAPSDYPNAAKAMAEVLRKDALLQSELSMVQAQLLRPTVQIQPDRSMVHIPRPSLPALPDMQPEPLQRRARQGLPRMGRPPALVDLQESAAQSSPPPAARRSLPLPEPQPNEIAARRALPLPEPQPDEIAARRALPPPEPQPEDFAASPTLPLADLPAPGDPIEGSYTLWPLAASMPTMRALPALGQPDDTRDADAPWADLISDTEDQSNDHTWSTTPPTTLNELIEPVLWNHTAEEPAPPWLADSPASLSAQVEPLPWEHSATTSGDQPAPEEPAPPWLANSPASLSTPVEPLPWDYSPIGSADRPLLEEPAPWPAEPAASLSTQVEPLPWDYSTIASDEQDRPATEVAPWEPSAGTEPELPSPPVDGWRNAPAARFQSPAQSTDETPWNDRASSAEAEIAADQPAFLNSDLVDDLGFSLDWSEPPAYEQAADAPAPPADTSADELGFSLDWSEPQADPYASAWAPSVGSTTNDSIIMAHWDDPASVVPEPAPFSDPASAALATTDPVAADFDFAAAPDFEPPQPDAMVEPSAEQESSPWYAPTLPIEEHAPFEPAADDSGYAPLETFGMAWAEQPAAIVEPASDASADAFPATNQALDEQPEATAEPPSELTPGDANELITAQAAPEPEIPTEQIAHIIGMIQSYGPAWFKMWSLELKERPERLPVVLGEVTADPVLLAQADDPRVQSALLQALAAYAAPPAFPARLPAPMPLPSPAIAGQGDAGEDEVPDWLSLRVKWNGHGGGA